MTSKLTYAPDVWRLLNGILCVYKPVETTTKIFSISLGRRICEELNQMKTRPQQTYVDLVKIGPGEDISSLKGKKVVATVPDGEETIAVVERPSYADHTAVTGPRYMGIDIKRRFANNLGYRFSGLTVLGINAGCITAERIRLSRWLRVYNVSGKFGIGTRTFFADGPIAEKATFHKINRPMLERILAASQSSHQRLMFQSAGVPLDSQRAYELASEGMIRPSSNTVPLVYSLKLLELDLPTFQIEIKVINETDEYLATLIHELGLKLNTVAACTKIHCVKYGPFELKHALLKKHWSLDNIIANLNQNSRILKDFKLNMRDPIVHGQSRENEETNDTVSNKSVSETNDAFTTSFSR